MTVANASIYYTQVAKTKGTEIIKVLDATAKDTDRATISEGEKYKFIVMSVADGTNANTNSLSGLTDELELKSGVAVENISEINTKIYPNPATDMIIVELPNAGIYQAEIYNVAGKLLLSNTIEQKSEIKLSDLSSGIYLLKITGENFTVNKKFTKK